MDISPSVNRRQFVAGAGVIVAATAGAATLAACGSNDSSSATTTSAAASTTAAPGVLAPVAQIPVGGGIIVDGVVLTQPSAGKISGFTATCTHEGCKLSGVTDGKIDCPCHGSKFNLDGTVAHGPAATPLPAVAVKVSDGNVVRG
ncbi:Rieske (2Fe-2S) protein [Gordonia sp. TBRC 11910]|uniref:Cytochrome bc1 complex Rieske iron-sulfur subunit n=1 Tax=Gordonia asplenii TaxID=2725283 RepID=A0A848L781_9ACTN|nr:Rieske (2Fe-2S) protein [Gordonia asplenii]NMO04855.1 Rieske (2Fe-2S) protein [Gordonia asplenii]